MANPSPAPPRNNPTVRRPGVVESVFSWIAWLLVSAAALIIGFASIFPLSFSGAYPDQADAAANVFGWALLTLFACLCAPVIMGLGHWRHWHIWYWPMLCGAALAWTSFLLHSL